jgi:DNA polymerase/3'-5' exonuclease PolX
VSPYACSCRTTERLCDACVDETLAQLRGVAQCRGEGWARAIAKVIPIDKPWPDTERMRAIARRKIDDLTRDERLSELLASEVVVGAARWWNRALEQAG